MQDRVFNDTRRGDRAGAVAELERWVARHPRDANALVSLARLLNETGRADDAIVRYRQALAVNPRVVGDY
jgi:Flp pilus assembly protein TadD